MAACFASAAGAATLSGSGTFGSYTQQGQIIDIADVFLGGPYGVQNFQLDFDYDKTAIPDMNVHIYGWYGFHVFLVDQNTWYWESRLPYDANFDPNSFGDILEKNTGVPLLTLQSTDTGLRLIGWDIPQPCADLTGKSYCSSVEAFRGVWISGAGDGSAVDYSYSITAGPKPGAVPEPATWALMIAGFGMVGLSARRRRQEPGFLADAS